MSRRNVLEQFIRYEKETEERVNHGIENYRKGECLLTFTDADGQPLCNAEVKIKQKNHDFKHGANIFMLDEMESDEKNKAYKKYFAAAFNMATLPFYWNDLEPEKGKPRFAKSSPKIYRRPPIDLCMEFCEQNGIEPREHALAYDSMFPKWIKELPVEEIKKELSRRMEEIAKRYAARIPTIEVTNETFWDADNCSAFYCEDDFVEWCFKEAEKYFPDNELTINEAHCRIWDERATNRDMYYMQIERALQKGARIDAIGFQFHMFLKREEEYSGTKKFYNPMHLFRIMDKYSDFNLPMQITELTIPAYSWEKEDEELQAELITRLYRIWFSQKNMEQIIYWNLVDGYAFGADIGDMEKGENYYHGGLLRHDMTPKPAYYAIKNLFEKEWHTEISLATDSGGKISFRGFYGDYEAEINSKKYSFGLHKNTEGAIEIKI